MSMVSPLLPKICICSSGLKTFSVDMQSLKSSHHKVSIYDIRLKDAPKEFICK